MAWYNAGTVAVTNNSANVTGTGTVWTDNADAGQSFIGPDGLPYEIASVVSATSLTLATPYRGATASGQAYRIMPVQGYLRDLATSAAQLVLSFTTVRDGVGQGIFPSGSVGTPGFRFSGDEDTGFYRPGANLLAGVVGGVEAWRTTSTGLGIGTTAPRARFHSAGAVIDAVPSLTAATGSAFFSGANTGYGLGLGQRSNGNTWLQAGRADGTSGGYDIELNPIGGNVIVGNIIYPSVDNGRTLAWSGGRFSTGYFGSNIIVTSDAREKLWIGTTEDRRAKDRRIASAILEELGWFQFLDAVEEKGEDSARWHFGARAQAVWAIVAAEGLCAPLIGEGAEQKPDPAWTGPPPPAWLCFDIWPEERSTVPVYSETLIDEDGKPLQTGTREVVTREAGNRFGLRADQLALLLVWAQGEHEKEKAATIAQLAATIGDLSDRLEALEAA